MQGPLPGKRVGGTPSDAAPWSVDEATARPLISAGAGRSGADMRSPAVGELLPRATAEAAIAAGRMIGLRVTDPARLRIAVAAAARQTHYPQSVHWEASSTAQGNAGCALLCACLEGCFPGENWDRLGHDHLTFAIRGAEQHHHLPSSIYGGVSGIALAADLLSRNGARYRSLRRSLDAQLIPAAVSAGRALASAPAGFPVSQFDMISGLAGVTAYLLRPTAGGEINPALEPALAGLASLAQTIDGLPRWYTPPEFVHDEKMRHRYPEGNINLGLAHGIPGPLAIMSLGLLQGHDDDGLRAAVQVSARQLGEWCCEDRWGVNWPTVLDTRAVIGNAGGAVLPTPSRSAWCYGTPGVARALWLAGRALGDNALQALAVEAMTAVYRRPVAERSIDSPSFCHGVAGLLQVTIRFALDTGLPIFIGATRTLTEQILDACDPARPLGVAHVEPDGNLVDQPGLLDGASGVAMTLLAAGTGVEPVWDRLFALA